MRKDLVPADRGVVSDDTAALAELARTEKLYERYVRLARLTEIPQAESLDAEVAPDCPPVLERPFELVVGPCYPVPPMGLSIRSVG
jgi:hypothetical protein